MIKNVEMASGVCESVLCEKNDVFVYNIPARVSNRGYRYSFDI